MTLSLTALLAANLVPLIGVVFGGWSIFEVFALYWSENVVIGGYAVLRILTATGMPLGARLFAAPFFVVHYGLFCFVHSVFVVGLTAEGGFPGQDVLEAPLLLLATAAATAGGTGLLALAVSHGVSFVRNWLLRERACGAPGFFAPYGRIIVMHVVLLAGGFATLALGRGPVMLALLVVAKVIADVAAHRAEHRARDGGPAARE